MLIYQPTFGQKVLSDVDHGKIFIFALVVLINFTFDFPGFRWFYSVQSVLIKHILDFKLTFLSFSSSSDLNLKCFKAYWGFKI